MTACGCSARAGCSLGGPSTRSCSPPKARSIQPRRRRSCRLVTLPHGASGSRPGGAEPLADPSRDGLWRGGSALSMSGTPRGVRVCADGRRGADRLLDQMPNVFEPEWDAEQEKPPFRWHRARIGRQAGSQKLGASLYDIPPGASTWPLHIHHANEELLVVLSGRPTLRGPGWRTNPRAPARSSAVQPGVPAPIASITAVTTSCACSSSAR